MARNQAGAETKSVFLIMSQCHRQRQAPGEPAPRAGQPPLPHLSGSSPQLGPPSLVSSTGVRKGWAVPSCFTRNLLRDPVSQGKASGPHGPGRGVLFTSQVAEEQWMSCPCSSESDKRSRGWAGREGWKREGTPPFSAAAQLLGRLRAPLESL